MIYKSNLYSMGKRNRPRTEAEVKADRARTGRPPKSQAEKQSEHVTVHLTPAERKRLEKLAKKDGLSLPALIMRPWREKGSD